ncbi:MAG: DUF2231 domain-containing protein [Thermoplasmatota archaeon]
MRSHVHVARHPLHPMIVVFPTAMFPLLVVLDIVELVGLTASGAGLGAAGFWVAAVGLVGTLAAISIGIVDLAAIPDEARAHRTAFIHFAVGLAIAAAYAVATVARFPGGPVSPSASLLLVIDIVGALLVTVQGFLGGELVFKHHIGVLAADQGADPVELKGPR